MSGLISKNTQTSNFMKIRQVGAEVFPENGRTDGLKDQQVQGDMKKLVVASRNFADTPKRASC